MAKAYRMTDAERIIVEKVEKIRQAHADAVGVIALYWTPEEDYADLLDELELSNGNLEGFNECLKDGAYGSSTGSKS